MTTFSTPLALALSLALTSISAHAQMGSPASEPKGEPTQAATVGEDRQTSLAHEDERFLKNAIQGSHAEILGTQLALEKSENDDVKQFAQKMIEDHGKMVQEADALATSKGMEPPSGPSALQSTEIAALKALSGGAFDTMYVNRIGVASHESTVTLFEKAAQEAKDPDIKAMATKTLPKLQEHLKMANSLNEKQDKQ